MSDKMIPSAFPLLPPVDDNGQSAFGYPFPDPGMTLRDYFAAKALQSFMLWSLDQRPFNDYDTAAKAAAAYAKSSYSIADAMLKARAQ